MARSFAVTTASNQVSLDKDGKGQAVFTVTNSSARDLDGRATVASSDAAQAAWLTIVGEATRKFSPSATEQYAVQVAVPPGTAAATLTFGLNVVAVDRPDEDFTEGPVVSATYTPPGPERKKKFPWWIVIIVAIVLLGGGVTLALISGGSDKATVPDVLGKNVEKAKDILDADGIKWKVVTSTVFEESEDTVTSVVPGVGESIAKDQEVVLKVARPPVLVTKVYELSHRDRVDFEPPRLKLSPVKGDIEFYLERSGNINTPVNTPRLQTLEDSKLGIISHESLSDCQRRDDLSPTSDMELTANSLICLHTAKKSVVILKVLSLQPYGPHDAPNLKMQALIWIRPPDETSDSQE